MQPRGPPVPLRGEGKGLDRRTHRTQTEIRGEWGAGVTHTTKLPHTSTSSQGLEDSHPGINTHAKMFQVILFSSRKTIHVSKNVK